jgi:hypothetical protein
LRTKITTSLTARYPKLALKADYQETVVIRGRAGTSQKQVAGAAAAVFLSLGLSTYCFFAFVGSKFPQILLKSRQGRDELALGRKVNSACHWPPEMAVFFFPPDHISLFLFLLCVFLFFVAQ